MALQYSAQGLVFKKEDRLEADRVFSVFTREFGRLQVFAKSIRAINSKLKSGIEIFSLSELSFIQGKNRKTLTDAMALERFGGITESFEKLAVADQACDLLDRFIAGPEPDDRLWNLLLDFFEKLNALAPGALHQRLYFYFFWNFVGALGYAPELSRCALCQAALNQTALYFSANEGGVVCGRCAKSSNPAVAIHSDVVKILRLFLKQDWQTVAKLKVALPSQKSLRQVSGQYLQYLTHKLS